MPIVIGINIASLRAQRQLSIATDGLQRTIERVSSGLRINKASDDAAGLSIASALNADARIATASIRNVNDGLSLIQIGDSALGQISNILERMAELAEQSANSVFSNTQRSAMGSEFVALGSEIERIAVTTKFNNIDILSGNSGTVLQVGFDSYSTSQLVIQGIQGTLQSMNLANAGSSKLSVSITGNTPDEAVQAARTALDTVKQAVEAASKKRGLLGAAESRISIAINNLQSMRLNFQQAAGRIMDADMAEEVALLVTAQIKQQAAAAVLAQANQQPTRVLDLLKVN